MKKALLILVCLSGCALPGFTVKSALDAPPGAFTGANCKVRVESMSFDPNVRLGAQSEAEFLAGLSPQQQQSYAADKVDFTRRYFENLAVNERDYLKNKGTLVVAESGDQPFVVRSRVILFEPRTGHLVAVHELFSSPQQSKVAEFNIESEIGTFWGSGMRMRFASVAQSMTLLKYFADRFACR